MAPTLRAYLAGHTPRPWVWNLGRLRIVVGGWCAGHTWRRQLLFVTWDTGEPVEQGCR